MTSRYFHHLPQVPKVLTYLKVFKVLDLIVTGYDSDSGVGLSELSEKRYD